MKKSRKGYKIFLKEFLRPKIITNNKNEIAGNQKFSAISAFAIKTSFSFIAVFFLFLVFICSCFVLFDYEPAFAQNKIDFVKAIGMVISEKNQAPVADCLVLIGQKSVKTNENGFFEITNIISGEYSIKVEHPQYSNYIEIKNLDQPINGLKISLKTEKQEETLREKANKEYDKLWAKVMKLNKKEIIIGEESDKKKVKSSDYYSKYGRKTSSDEPVTGHKYSKITPEEKEKSKSPKIDVKGGFGKLIGRVYESNGSQIEIEARISFGPQTVKTSEFGAFDVENVPAGLYSVTIRAKGYVTKVYEKVKIKNGINKYDFYLTKSAAATQK